MSGARLEEPAAPAAWERPAPGAAAEIAADIAARVPAITTSRLLLRAPRICDFEIYARIATTDRGLHIGGPMSRQEAWLDFLQMAAGWLMRGHGLWTVECRATAEVFGFIPVVHEFGDPEPELGFLFTAEAEGRGYASEAAGAARDFAFERLGWNSVASYIASGNARSIRLAERLGARPDPRVAIGDGMLAYRHHRREAGT
jgi:RimJ/RimL family protein N-acetyltransferase